MTDPAGPFTRGGEFFFTTPSTGGSSSPASGTWKLGQIARDTAGGLWVCTVAGTPGTWVSAGGSGSGPPFSGTGTVASTGTFRGANGAASGIYWRNNANTGDIGWSVGAFDNLASTGTTAVYAGAGGTRGTVEKFRAGGTAVTGDNSGNALFVPSATTSKPLVVQLLASQAANALEVQDSTATILASVSAAGALVASAVDAGSGLVQTTGTVKGAIHAGTGTVASTGGLRLANGASTGIYWRNNGNSADIGFSVGAFDNIATSGTTALYVTAGGTRGTVEKLRVANTATTADNSANAMFLSSATTSKPLVLQGLAAQSATLLEAQDSTGAILASISAAGAIVSAGLDAGSSTIVTTGSINGATITGSTALRVGSSGFAQSGGVRLPNAIAITARNAAASADVSLLQLNASDQAAVGADFVPGSDNTRALGTSSARWTSVSASTFVGVGTNVASTGGVRLANNTSVNWRNAANSADMGITVNASNNLVLNASAATNFQFGGSTIFQITSGSAVTVIDGVNVALGGTSGTKFGTATSHKLAFWNKTPIVQPTTGITGAAFVAGGGAGVTRTDTFGGYTLEQLAAVIINTGLAA